MPCRHFSPAISPHFGRHYSASSPCAPPQSTSTARLGGCRWRWRYTLACFFDVKAVAASPGPAELASPGGTATRVPQLHLRTFSAATSLRAPASSAERLSRGASERHLFRLRTPSRPPAVGPAPPPGGTCRPAARVDAERLPRRPLSPRRPAYPPRAPLFPMARRVQAEPRRALAAHPMPFVALRCGTDGVVASASDSVDLARLMIV